MGALPIERFRNNTVDGETGHLSNKEPTDHSEDLVEHFSFQEIA